MRYKFYLAMLLVVLTPAEVVPACTGPGPSSGASCKEKQDENITDCVKVVRLFKGGDGEFLLQVEWKLLEEQSDHKMYEGVFRSGINRGSFSTLVNDGFQDMPTSMLVHNCVHMRW